MPQYYFSVKLIAKRRPVKIRQEKMKKIRNLFFLYQIAREIIFTLYPGGIKSNIISREIWYKVNFKDL